VAITHVATAAAAHGTVSCAPAYPTGIAAGDTLILVAGINPTTATAPTLTGWTKQLDVALGSRDVAVYTKDTVTGSETGTISFAPTSASNVSAAITAWSGAQALTLTLASGADSTSNTTFTATANAVLAETTGDVMLIGAIAGSNSGISSSAVTATGATYGTWTQRTQSGTTNLRLLIGDRPITAGTATAAPVFTSTMTVSTTGGVAFIRLRESAPPTLAISASGTATASGVAAALLRLAVTASGSATPTGAVGGALRLAASASGSATAAGSTAANLALTTLAAGTATATGSAALVVVGRTFELAASGSAASSGSVSLAQAATLTLGSGTGAASGSAALTAVLRASAIGTGVASGSAAASLEVAPLPLTASGGATATGSATVRVTLTAAAAGGATATGTASLTSIQPLTAQGAAQAAGTAELARLLQLAASGTATSSGSASLAQAQDITFTAVLAPRRIDAGMGERRTTSALNGPTLVASVGQRKVTATITTRRVDAELPS
jgi:MSHA biogenesis protein MshQ